MISENFVLPLHVRLNLSCIYSICLVSLKKRFLLIIFFVTKFK